MQHHRLIASSLAAASSPVRFLYEGNWQKPFDGEEMYSSENGIIIRFKNENDFAVLTRSFKPIRIAVVVKENSKFVVKLILLASAEKFVVAAGLNEPFDRNTAKENRQFKTTLILGMSSTENLCLTVMALPPRELPRQYKLCYDESMKKFHVPEELVVTSEIQTQCLQPNRHLNAVDLPKVN